MTAIVVYRKERIKAHLGRETLVVSLPNTLFSKEDRVHEYSTFRS